MASLRLLLKHVSLVSILHDAAGLELDIAGEFRVPVRVLCQISRDATEEYPQHSPLRLPSGGGSYPEMT